MQISIIIPLYNYEQYIGECLKSCLLQDYGGDYEIVVIDDCSTDNSFEVVREMKNDKIVLLKTSKNSGYSAAKNHGIRNSLGEYIVHLDADDLLTCDSLSKRAVVLDQLKGIDVVHGQAKMFDGNHSLNWCNRHASSLRTHPSYIHAQGVMLRREVYKNYGLYCEGLRSKADKEMWQRIGVYKSCNKPYAPWIKWDAVKDVKLHTIVAYYRRHPKAMKVTRRKDKEYDMEIDKTFYGRINQLRKEGITPHNTRFL